MHDTDSRREYIDPGVRRGWKVGDRHTYTNMRTGGRNGTGQKSNIGHRKEESRIERK
jgi:hypothetical protein